MTCWAVALPPGTSVSRKRSISLQRPVLIDRSVSFLKPLSIRSKRFTQLSTHTSSPTHLRYVHRHCRNALLLYTPTSGNGRSNLARAALVDEDMELPEILPTTVSVLMTIIDISGSPTRQPSLNPPRFFKRSPTSAKS